MMTVNEIEAQVPQSLEELVQGIHDILGPDGGLDSEHIDQNEIIRLMQSYTSNSKDWAKYGMFDLSRPYTRNLVDDGNGKFNLMIIAWSPGRNSPIHDHSGSHCIMKILDGRLLESQYEYPTKLEEDVACSNIDITDGSEDNKTTACQNTSAMHVTKDTILKSNQVAYISDKIGLHRIANPSTFEGAVSLHLYTPPFKTCKTFEETTGKARSASQCTFYSIRGARQEKGLL
ncbi:cysteine dioxygenase type I [Hesseltinella vesiculosa]|uniref:Cysteine dioxygenase n=1 Tax=Hesseltinella vesiculosa TaxID=101127 RepID=A0A1X2GUB5_9FUNG|nr:cysteine dioxygenase type I [Hesseltinella vesiculosa]